MVKNIKKFKVSGTKPTKSVASHRFGGKYHPRKERKLTPEAEDIFKRIKKIDDLIELDMPVAKLTELEKARNVLVARFKKFREGPPPNKPKAQSSKSIRTVESKVSYEQSSKSWQYNFDGNGPAFEGQQYFEDEEADEGRAVLKKHLSHERNTRIVKLKKKKAFEETGCLKCEVCDFDFFEIYGDLGSGFIECHHLVPLSKSSGNTKTKLSDLSLLCSNCHRMIHNKNPILTIKELREIMRAR